MVQLIGLVHVSDRRNGERRVLGRARVHRSRRLVQEKAPSEWAEGNSYFTAGAIRTTYDGLDDLRPIVENLTDELAATTELPP